MTKKEYLIVLFSITLCWASSYIFIKDIPQEFSAYAYLALTSGTAGIILAAVFHKIFRKMDKATLLRGSVLAILITGNIVFEKLGLDHLPASAVSAIASLNIVIVPLILVFKRQFPTRNNLAGIAVIIIGLVVSGRMSLQGGNFVGFLYVLASCIMMSLYTVLAADYTKKSDPLLLTVLQLCITAVIGLILWLATDTKSVFTIEWTAEVVSYIVIIAFFSKAYAYIMLMYAEKYADAISVTVVAATEPVVTLLLALVIPSTQGNTELFSARSLIGAFIIMAGAIIAGTGFLSKKKQAMASSEQKTEEPAAKPDAAREEKPERKGSVIRIFLVILVLFFVLCASINVYEFADGYSAIRPVNFIPTIAGLLLGPVGGAACALGNFFADLNWDYGWTMVLGIIGNFLAAWIPYKMWQNISGKKPHVHSGKNMLLYIWAAAVGSLTCAFVLTYGLEIFFGEIFPMTLGGIFTNNFTFSLIFGLPVFIVLTSEKLRLTSLPDKLYGKGKGSSRRAQLFFAADTVMLLGILAGDLLDLHWENSLLMKIISIICVVLCALTFLPADKAAAMLSGERSRGK